MRGKADQPITKEVNPTTDETHTLVSSQRTKRSTKPANSLLRLHEAEAELTRLRAENTSIYEQIKALLVLQDVANTLNSELDLNRLLKQIMESASKLSEAEASSLMLIDYAADELVFEVIEGEKAEVLAQHRIKLNQGIAGWVATRSEPLIVNNASRDPRFFAGVDQNTQFTTRSLAAVPLIFKQRTIGVLEVINKRQENGFEDKDLDLLTTLAAQAAIAIENARLYQNLREEREKIITTQEEVRKQLARDLHDGPAQAMASIAMNIDFIRLLLQHEPEKADEELQQLSERVLQTTRDIRNLLFDLRPLVLEVEGLGAALERFLERFRREGVQINLDSRNYVARINSNAEHAAFAVIQEAVNNALKHAKARHIAIVLQCPDSQFIATVQDDGEGFDVEAVTKNYEKRGSWGLLNMRERIELVDGTLHFQSQPNKGTVITITIPRH